jgi:DDE domain
VSTATASYQGHRYPLEIINHSVWLYFRFSLSFREVEELMLARGVVVSYEWIRRWCAKFGQGYANQLRRRRPHPGDTWHLDEVFVKINGITHYLWTAVDQHGNVLDVLVTEELARGWMSLAGAMGGHTVVDAELLHLLDEFLGVGVVVLQVAHDRLDLAINEVTHQFDYGGLFITEIERDDPSPS